MNLESQVYRQAMELRASADMLEEVIARLRQTEDDLEEAYRAEEGRLLREALSKLRDGLTAGVRSLSVSTERMEEAGARLAAQEEILRQNLLEEDSGLF